jgi:hypothetical protein
LKTGNAKRGRTHVYTTATGPEVHRYSDYSNLL